MNIKRQAPQLNRLRIPIYSMECYNDFLYFGGGGGYEIKNQIVGYQYELGKTVVSKIVHTEMTGDAVANYMMLPKDGTNVLVACIDKMVCFYDIDRKTGKLTVLQSFQADFSEENPSVNHVTLSLDNQIFVTAGDDKVIRVFQISKDFKKNEKKLELTMAEQPVVSVDVSRANKYLVAGSKDGTAYIADLTKKG